MNLLVAACFCIYQAHTEKKREAIAKSNIKVVAKMSEYQRYCLNGGESYYLVDEDIFGCKGSWLYSGVHVVKRTCGGSRLEIGIRKD